ncbi:MAG: hypothetical protein IPL19_20575 [Sandaracinaceae bacterium]|nr:hypothetical protein [Sandaracinaceae bacterium]
MRRSHGRPEMYATAVTIMACSGAMMAMSESGTGGDGHGHGQVPLAWTTRCATRSRPSRAR